LDSNIPQETSKTDAWLGCLFFAHCHQVADGLVAKALYYKLEKSPISIRDGFTCFLGCTQPYLTNSEWNYWNKIIKYSEPLASE